MRLLAVVINLFAGPMPEQFSELLELLGGAADLGIDRITGEYPKLLTSNS
jgi:hypothetical protein